jgi:hypothetical protein
MDEVEVKLAALKLAIDLLMQNKITPKNISGLVDTAKYFSNYILDEEDDDDEDNAPKREHGAGLSPLSENK